MIKLHVFIYIYIANLDCHDLNVSALAALAPPIRHVDMTFDLDSCTAKDIQWSMAVEVLMPIGTNIDLDRLTCIAYKSTSLSHVSIAQAFFKSASSGCNCCQFSSTH